ncbi:hypothetical protein GCM10027047_18070 [Rhodococcus aerolatus]
MANPLKLWPELSPHPGNHEGGSWSRLNFLVDGILAIAATLLVLDLRVPDPTGPATSTSSPGVGPGELGHELTSALAPAYLGYATGFLFIAGGWLAIRRLARYMPAIDHWGTVIVLVTLGFFVLTPFAVQVFARSTNDESDNIAALRLLSIIMLATSIGFGALVEYLHRVVNNEPSVHPDRWSIFRTASRLAWVLPSVALALTFVNELAAGVALALNVLVNFWPNDGHGLGTAAGQRPRVHAADVPTTEHSPAH